MLGKTLLILIVTVGALSALWQTIRLNRGGSLDWKGYLALVATLLLVIAVVLPGFGELFLFLSAGYWFFGMAMLPGHLKRMGLRRVSQFSAVLLSLLLCSTVVWALFSRYRLFIVGPACKTFENTDQCRDFLKCASGFRPVEGADSLPSSCQKLGYLRGESRKALEYLAYCNPFRGMTPHLVARTIGGELVAQLPGNHSSGSFQTQEVRIDTRQYDFWNKASGNSYIYQCELDSQGVVERCRLAP